MVRKVDKHKTRKALRRLRRAAERMDEEGGAGLTPWEKDFVEGVTDRLEKFGSAFRDPGKGRLDEALSERQTHVSRTLEKKSRRAKRSLPDQDEPQAPARRSTLKRKSPLRSKRKPAPPPEEDSETSLTPDEKRAGLRVIKGGK